MNSIQTVAGIIEALNAGSITTKLAVSTLSTIARQHGVKFSESVARRTKAQCVESAYALQVALEGMAARSGHEEAERIVAKALSPDQPTAEQRAVKALKKYGSDRAIESLAAVGDTEAVAALAAMRGKTDAQVRDEAFGSNEAPATDPAPEATPRKRGKGAPATAFEKAEKPAKAPKVRVSRFEDSKLVVLVRSELLSGLDVATFADRHAATLGTNSEKLSKEVRNVVDRLRSKGEAVSRIGRGVFAFANVAKG